MIEIVSRLRVLHSFLNFSFTLGFIPDSALATPERGSSRAARPASRRRHPPPAMCKSGERLISIRVPGPTRDVHPRPRWHPTQDLQHAHLTFPPSNPPWKPHWSLAHGTRCELLHNPNRTLRLGNTPVRQGGGGTPPQSPHTQPASLCTLSELQHGSLPIGLWRTNGMWKG